MFGLFKKKLKDIVDSFSSKAEEEAEKQIEEPKKEEFKEENREEKKSKKFLGLFKIKHKEEAPEEIKGESIEEKIDEIPVEEKYVEKPKEEPKEENEERELKIKEEIVKEDKKEKTGFFEKLKGITKVRINEEKFEKLFEELETILLENNVAYEVIDKIKEDLKMDIVNVPINNVRKTIHESLRKTLNEILDVPKLDIIEKIKEIKKENRSAVFLVLGYNGSGKSITCAKFARYLKDKNFKSFLAAGDTFRAAGSLQLASYANIVGVPVLQLQEQKGDSCALIFDAIKSANSRKLDVVIADTAGRIHSNADLMDELKKIVRVNKPDLKILVLDSLTGNDVVEQCKQFDKAVGVDALIFTKVDAYEKGGSLLSAAYILNKPILFLGIGQDMSSLKEYDKEEILESLGLD